MPEAGPGKIRLFHDFAGVGEVVANTTDTAQIGDFFMGGESFEVATSGAAGVDALSGVLRITTDTTDADTAFIGTQICFDVGLMGPLMIETRVQMPDFETKELYFGLTSILTIDEQLQDVLINSSATALTLTAGLCGFYFSDELTASATEWHGVYNGGSAAASTTVADVNLGTAGDNNPTAGEWQILRLVVDTNGTAEWFINGGSVQKVVGAVSTSTDFAVSFACGANTTQQVIADMDYLLVTANRDWTV